VALAAVLTYFQLQCSEEQKAKEVEERNRPAFNPDLTDVRSELGLCKLGEDREMTFGMEYILFQSFPCALTKLIYAINIALGKGTDVKKGEQQNEKHNVTFHDARKTNFSSFHESGFTLIQLDEEPATTDWRTQGKEEDADIKKFYAQMEPHLLALFPATRRIHWTYNVVRGGDRFGDQPRAVNGPHLDYHQGQEARREFHNRFPIPSWISESEAALLMGEGDDERGQLGVLLGVWKPILPCTAVCDFPLGVMDASTFKQENQGKNELHINFGAFTFHNLNGVISYDPGQRWAYYAFQTTKEVLVFHQFSR
jgi:hypothetical protein